MEILGRGLQLRLGLLKPAMQTVDFGTLTGGDSVTRTIVLVNRGPKTCKFQVADANGSLRSKQVSGYCLSRPCNVVEHVAHLAIRRGGIT